MPSARWWKEFYAEERKALGPQTLEAMLHTAPYFELPEPGIIIFPHTRLSASGHLIASLARAVIESGCETVLAIGVLHLGDRRGDATLRGIHGPGAPHDNGIWHDEFSLDNFTAFLEIAARDVGRPIPKLIARYPFLTGDDPTTLPGFDELQSIVADGAAIVATADMIHHGAGYGWPKESWLERDKPETLGWVRAAIQSNLEKLGRKDFPGFRSDCEANRSDFRDGGPLLAALLQGFSSIRIEDSTLVDYADALDAEAPTWVAAALVSITS